MSEPRKIYNHMSTPAPARTSVTPNSFLYAAERNDHFDNRDHLPTIAQPGNQFLADLQPQHATARAPPISQATQHGLTTLNTFSEPRESFLNVGNWQNGANSSFAPGYPLTQFNPYPNSNFSQTPNPSFQPAQPSVQYAPAQPTSGNDRPVFAAEAFPPPNRPQQHPLLPQARPRRPPARGISVTRRSPTRFQTPHQTQPVALETQQQQVRVGYGEQPGQTFITTHAPQGSMVQSYGRYPPLQPSSVLRSVPHPATRNADTSFSSDQVINEASAFSQGPTQTFFPVPTQSMGFNPANATGPPSGFDMVAEDPETWMSSWRPSTYGYYPGVVGPSDAATTSPSFPIPPQSRREFMETVQQATTLFEQRHNQGSEHGSELFPGQLPQGEARVSNGFGSVRIRPLGDEALFRRHAMVMQPSDIQRQARQAARRRNIRPPHAQIQHFTTLRASDPSHEVECPICQDSYNDKDHPAIQLQNVACTHVFGRDCLQEWINSGMENAHRCPSCRQSLAGALSKPKKPRTGKDGLATPQLGTENAARRNFGILGRPEQFSTRPAQPRPVHRGREAEEHIRRIRELRAREAAAGTRQAVDINSTQQAYLQQQQRSQARRLQEQQQQLAALQEFETHQLEQIRASRQQNAETREATLRARRQAAPQSGAWDGEQQQNERSR